MTVAKTEAERKLILGGKGAGLADMTAAGLPVPPGFTISIPCCEEYYKLGLKLSELVRLIKEAGRKPIERDTLYNIVREW